MERVLDRFAEQPTARNLRLARQAVQNARRDILLKNATPGWNYFQRRFYFTTEAAYSTGTVTYAHSTRQVTLSGGTWPTNAALGRVRINSIAYDVETRTSNSVVVLTEGENPGADVASTSYQWFRSSYPITAGFTQTTRFQQAGSSGSWLHPCSVSDGQALRNYDTPGTPIAYAIRGAGKVYGQVNIELFPPPSAATTYHAFAQVSPRPLDIEKESTGAVATTNGSATVTGTGTAFTSRMAGSVLRVANSSTNLPTSSVGGTDNTVTPAAIQATILSVASATSLTLSTAATSTLSNAKYTISDPLDVDPTTMLNLFWALADAEMAKQFRSEQQDRYRALVIPALTEAISLDAHRPADSTPLTWPIADARLRDIRANFA